jgi:hypothetical protein
MTARQLPDRPNLDHLKKQAKALLHAARAGDADALTRLKALPAFTGHTDPPVDAALHDAQSVIAREYGFDSWNALREEIEARTLTFEHAVDEFVRAAVGGLPDRAWRLLALHPRIADATVHTALVRGDEEAVSAHLNRQPELATTPGGPLNWEPLLYVCHTCLLTNDREGSQGLVATATRLCAHGANPNAEYHWNWHPELPRTALWAALCTARHLPLAEALLKAGANPTDGVSAHITGGQGNLAALELLVKYGMDVDGIPGGVPPLVYTMFWSTDPTGPRWLVQHGANPNLAWGPDGEAPLHVAARRWDLAMVELLVSHGANIHHRRADGRTAHTSAELFGHRDIAMWLREQGAQDELTSVERFAAACARADESAADAMLASEPTLRASLQLEHHLMLQRPAESGDGRALETMLARGFDPNTADREGWTPLHRAAMAGHPDATRVLLAHGASVDALDATFAATPLVGAVEGRRHPEPGADHVAVARLLLDAGSSTTWEAPPGAPGEERTQEDLADLVRAARM